MAFCSFSKEFSNGAFTLVENRFIQKYLPEANDFAVKVYLYGLYLCQSGGEDFSASSLAEVLRSTEEKILNAFELWQDYDLVEILCRQPLTVQYLPVRSAVGKPKKVRYDKYADFNKEMQKRMQKVGRHIEYGESVKYMQFLEENDIQPMAFLLITEYCIAKDGTGITPHHVFNKAKKFIREGITTYEQVEAALGNYNENEKYIEELFKLLAINRRVDESDYTLYSAWLRMGFEKGGIKAAAKHLKKGKMSTLQLLLEEVASKEKFSARDVAAYLTEREALSALTFRLGRKLGVKIANPATYIDEYVEKWVNLGYEESSLLEIALYCLKCGRGDFACMHEQVESLFAAGIIGEDSVKETMRRKNADLKLLGKLGEYCVGIKPTVANLELLNTWREWSLSDEMIVEAAKRAANSAAPIPYINRILSEWKRAGYTTMADLAKEEKPTSAKPTGGTPSYLAASIEAANAKAAREKYYADKREKALSVADRYEAKANSNPRFGAIEKALSKMNIELAKAELYAPDTLPNLKEQQTKLLCERLEILAALGIEEWQLSPQFACKKCSDTGFVENGASCDCYKPNEI
ncbi:MAG: DnaD domain protein [Clostridia bacterium]|nr:DnaD domain protein [Clostridia bacterium]